MRMNSKNAHKNPMPSIEAVYIFYLKRSHAHKIRLKYIYRIQTKSPYATTNSRDFA